MNSKKKEYLIFGGDSSSILKNVDIFEDNSIDLIITSPPYADKRKKTYGGVPVNEYIDWFLPISEQLFRILKPKGSFVLNIKEHPIGGELQTYVLELILEMKKQGWLWVEEYCWVKKNSFPGKWPNRFRNSWERCLHFSKQKNIKMYQNSVKVPIGDWSKKRFNSMSSSDFSRHISGTNGLLSRNVSNWLKIKKVNPPNILSFEEENYVAASNVLEYPTACSNRKHGAVFPVELPTWFIKLFTRKNDIVLDPFCGVGTSGIAALLTGRKFIGIEILEEYVLETKKNLEEILEIQKNSNKVK